MLGNIEPYILGQPFDEYVERLDLFFMLNEFDETKKRAFFLVSIGSRTYSVLKSQCHPHNPVDKQYTELVTMLKEHFSRPNVVAERYKFNQLNQKAYQSVSDYISVLKKGASNCNYDGFLNEALRDRFICGVHDNKLRDLLLNILDLTFDMAEVLALEFETNEANRIANISQNKFSNHRLKGGHRTKRDKEKENENTECEDDDEEYDNGDSVRSENHGSNSKRKTCHGCNIYHNIEDCPAQNKHCFKCNKTGHIAAYCSQPAEVQSARTNENGRKAIRYDTIQYRNRGARND